MDTQDDEIIRELCNELRTRHNCHTVILYGSRAVGGGGPESDYDIAGFGTVPETIRDARMFRGRFVDVFIYPEARLSGADEELLKLHGGRVLFERDNAGRELLRRVDELFRKGPDPLSPDEMQARRVWAWKMLERGSRQDIEANYRRHWLLTALLEDYFVLRNRWFLGPKRSFAWLKEHDPKAFGAFEHALKESDAPQAIEALVLVVAGQRPA